MTLGVNNQAPIVPPNVPLGMGPDLQEPLLPENEPLLPLPGLVLENQQQEFPDVQHANLVGVEVEEQPVQQQPVQQQPAVPPPNTVAFMFDGHITYMPIKGLEAMDADDIPNFIRNQVNIGRDLFTAIMNNTAENRPATKNELRSLMWYLQALGSSKAGLSSPPPHGPALFKEGAFTIEDPDGRLEAWLNNANSYSRSSTHLGNFQKGPGGGHRGVDINAKGTPNERSTILFGRMPQNNLQGGHPARGMGRRMLYLKMEPYGCRPPFSPRGGHRPSPQGFLGHAAAAWRGFKRMFVNVGHFLGHAKETVKSVFNRNAYAGEQNNRERVHEGLTTPYLALRRQIGEIVQFPAVLKNELFGLLDANGPTKSHGGIRVMLENLRQVRDRIEGLAFGDAGDVQDELLESIDQLITTLEAQGDHSDFRIGQEVILLAQDTILGPDNALV